MLRVLSPGGDEVTFPGAIDPHTPVAQGWLRMSHRKLDPGLSTPYRPYHAHDEIQPLTPDAVYQADVEIWPTSLVIPAGYQVALTIRGRDYERHHPGAPRLGSFKNELTGCGPFLHDDPADRPAAAGRQHADAVDRPDPGGLPAAPGHPARLTAGRASQHRHPGGSFAAAARE